MTPQIAIIGGGAAGFFCAAILAETIPAHQITIFERAQQVLQKVKISGGGRCNVTHACFDPKELVLNYPRGSKELLGPFFKYSTQDTIEWFEKNGVELKTEKDGRMFPLTNSSQTVVDCLWTATIGKGVRLEKQCAVTKFETVDGRWKLETENEEFFADALVIATGSSQQFWNVIGASTNHSLVAPVPSLFTFNCNSDLIKALPGVSIPNVEINITDSEFSAIGPALITHWGLSGPAVLRLSAWGAKWLHDKNYIFDIEVNWVPEWDKTKALEWLILQKKTIPQKEGSHY